MKGGLVAMVHAASALRKAGVPLSGDLWVTGVIGHEDPNGKKEGPRRLIQHLRSGKIHTDAIIIGEGPCAIWRASLGFTLFTVTISSERGHIHTTKLPYDENPARWMAELLIEFERLERQFSEAAPHPLCGRERINVGIVSGGDYYNRLPTPTVVTGTWRWQPGKSQDDVQGLLRQICRRLAERSKLNFEVSFNATREPFETPEKHPLVRTLQSAGATVSGKVPEAIGMPIVGDGSLYANEARVPTVYYGPAYEMAHSDHERVSIAQLVHCARVYSLAAAIFLGADE
jgi:acetylornithine deacetylase/succinyl-diaminopimelate desuccinylase-like protein